ncbi:hypothetical protein CXB51_009613 [Gossypium anomalum]|uniref:Zinc knuckle CX2CX4HX4C domain-containing protein n=1 Tax=Gossypium anomalum TaxID=47600 RepID=A0A8J5Z6Z7_9ROSI|nr:hypothetical protein CXB51_009613 [Gossypium anomalum]
MRSNDVDVIGISNGIEKPANSRLSFKDMLLGASRDTGKIFNGSTKDKILLHFVAISVQRGCLDSTFRNSGFLYGQSILKSIEETIGQVIKLDVNTGNAQRGRFVHMMIFLDLNKPLVSEIKVDRRIQHVEYESLPNICFSCSHFGHFKDSCSFAPNRVTALGEMNQEKSISDENMKDSDMFRPWMVVNRRNSRLGRKSAIGRGERKVTGSMGSHFNIFHDLRDGN